VRDESVKKTKKAEGESVKEKTKKRVRDESIEDKTKKAGDESVKKKTKKAEDELVKEKTKKRRKAKPLPPADPNLKTPELPTRMKKMETLNKDDVKIYWNLIFWGNEKVNYVRAKRNDVICERLSKEGWSEEDLTNLRNRIVEIYKGGTGKIQSITALEEIIEEKKVSVQSLDVARERIECLKNKK